MAARSCYHPAITESAARLLKDRTSHYLYVSFISAYDSNDTQPTLTEDAALAPWNESGSWYSRGKAESERRLRQIVGERLTIVRPGPIKVYATILRTFWVGSDACSAAEKVIAPGNGTGHVEIVDVKDVADFLVLAIDRSIYRTFNLTGTPMTFR